VTCLELVERVGAVVRRTNEIKKILVSPDYALVDCLQQMNDAGLQLLLVVDADRRLIGTVTDGDVRRALLRNRGLNIKIAEVMCAYPSTVKAGTSTDKIRQLMLDRNIRHVPVIDSDGHIIDLILWTDLFEQKVSRRMEKVIIMAGGKGTRLDPFTKILPKPMIPLGDKPVIEIIMDGFYDNGFNDFILSLGYKADIVRFYFLESDTRPYHVNFIQEDKPLGTAGSLSLLKGQLKDTSIVTNCDIILEADYGDMLNFHRERHHDITVIGALKNFIIPYGVLQTEDGRLIDINEKPSSNYLVNTGVYIIEPAVISLVPDAQFMNMTDLIVKAKNNGFTVGVYSFDGRWFDVGQWDEYRKTLKAFEHVIGGY